MSKKTKKAAKAPAVEAPVAAEAPTAAAVTQLSTHEAAAFTGCNASSIVKWINDGKLKAYTTPGGHRRVLPVDLVAFLRASGSFVPPALEQLVNAA